MNNSYEQLLRDLGLDHLSGNHAGDVLRLIESMVSTAYEYGFTAGYDEGYEEGIKESPDVDIDEESFNGN